MHARRGPHGKSPLWEGGARSEPSRSRRKDFIAELHPRAAQDAERGGHFRARFVRFQRLAAPFPGDTHSACPLPIEEGKPRACGSTGPEGRHFRARIQSFQAFAAPFPGDRSSQGKPARDACAEESMGLLPSRPASSKTRQARANCAANSFPSPQNPFHLLQFPSLSFRELRTINGLRGLLAKKISLPRFPARRRIGHGRRRAGMIQE